MLSEGGLDVYGRRRSDGAASGPRNGLTTGSALPSKADRQKAALERLRNPVKKKEMSPPRSPRTHRSAVERFIK